MLRNKKYPKGNLYLSGGMEHSTDHGAGWRHEISPILKAKGFYPLDIAELDKLYGQEYGQSDLYHDFGEGEEGLLRRKARIRKHFIDADLQLIINDTEALIVYYDESARRGAGTISECQVAALHDIPVFIVSDWEDWQVEVPGWLHAISTKIFTSFDDLLIYLDRLPPGVLIRDQYGNRRSNDYYLCSLSGEPFQKTKTHFVSTVSPLYSSESVEIVKEVNEQMEDRYHFFREAIQSDDDFKL